MKQEDKELLLKDLSARLPYGVKVESVFINPDTKERKSCGIEVFDGTCLLMIRDGLGEFKPYLRPMSSMTEEEEKEYRNIDNRSYSCPIEYAHIPASDRIDWLNKHQFDYRGLIPKGLALESKEEYILNKQL